jgi:uncharacterized DUF497 family protein
MRGFEWDDPKAQSNLRTHGVTFVEAASVFSDDLHITRPDPLHSTDEFRFVTIGLSTRNRLLVVVHADRDDVIRIISARAATRSERNDYEEE